MNLKWIGVIVLAVIGILAAIAGIEYLTHPIHTLPSILGGKNIRGHYHKRGYAAIVVAVVALGAAVYLITRSRLAGMSGGATSAKPAGPQSSADSLLSAPGPAPEEPAGH